MTRGGYLAIIGFLVGMFAYHTYSTERTISKYEEMLTEKSIVQDSLSSIELRSNEVGNFLAGKIDKLNDSISSIKPDTIIINRTVIKNIKNPEYYVENRDNESQ